MNKMVLLNYDKVKYYCKKKNMTVAGLASELNVTRQTIRNWSIKPTFQYNLWHLEDVLGAEKNDLLAIECNSSSN